MHIIRRLQSETPYGLQDHTLLTDAANTINELATIGNQLVNLLNECLAEHTDIAVMIDEWHQATSR